MPVVQENYTQLYYMDAMRYCDDGACPASHSYAELVMRCDSLNRQPVENDSLLCEWSDGQTSQAKWDQEEQTVSCCPPKASEISRILKLVRPAGAAARWRPRQRTSGLNA